MIKTSYNEDGTIECYGLNSVQGIMEVLAEVLEQYGDLSCPDISGVIIFPEEGIVRVF